MKKREKKKQRLSSQNPKLKQTKECENSGGQKAERKRCKSRGMEGPEKPEMKAVDESHKLE